MRIFTPYEIFYWVDEDNPKGSTAMCSYCNIDLAIGSKSEFLFDNHGFLEKMKNISLKIQVKLDTLPVLRFSIGYNFYQPHRNLNLLIPIEYCSKFNNRDMEKVLMYWTQLIH